jgi:tripartite-type tricarboxylate transporter receptor subunit TctC
MIMPFVAKHLPGARFVITNRPGAGGQIGFEAIFGSSPDGYTLGAMPTPALSTFPVERAVRYRALDFTFLANVVDDPNTIYVAADSLIRSPADVVRAAKERPGQMSYGTTGIGSDDHLFMLAFEELTGVPPMTHAPFAGTAPLLAQVLGGHVPLGVGNVSELVVMLREGRIRLLGQAAAQRWKRAAETPTFREQGLDVVAGSARGIVGPPNMPEAVRTRLEQAFAAALADPDFHRDAERATMPLRPLVGSAYRMMAAEVDTVVRARWERRPWRS